MYIFKDITKNSSRVKNNVESSLLTQNFAEKEFLKVEKYL